MLKTAGYSLPTKVHIHGFLTVGGGQKMSKSVGTLISAETYLNHSDPSYLRYFYATKLSPRVEDIDLGLEEFVEKVNSDLVGKVVNLASRVGKFASTTGLSPEYPDDGGLFAAGAAKGDEIAAAYESCDYARAMRLIMELADAANPFVEHAKPWEMKKDADRQDELRDVCTVALNLVSTIGHLLGSGFAETSRRLCRTFGRTDHVVGSKPDAVGWKTCQQIQTNDEPRSN